MKNKHEYNGYANYETWLLCLNLDNNEYLYELFKNYEGCAERLQEDVEGIAWVEEFNGYKLEDTWTQRDWDEIHWIEVLLFVNGTLLSRLDELDSQTNLN